MDGTECCARCTYCYELVLLDYSEGGCKHENLSGYVCMAFGDERIAMWISGLDKNSPDICECYMERKAKNDD